MNNFDVPVVLFVFRKLDTVKMIFKVLEEVKPTKLYVFSDGSRDGNPTEEKKVNEVREFVKNAVTWKCQTNFEFSEKNKGCTNNICQGLDTVFSKEAYALVFEDDVVPMKEFFVYSQYLLEKYKDNKKIQYIAGFNAVGDTELIKESYAFSWLAPLSGAFAIWADRWLECDMSMEHWPDNKRNGKLRKYFYSQELYNLYRKVFDESYKGIGEGWDYQFHHDMFDKGRYAIVPKGNLAKNYIFAEGALHPQKEKSAERLAELMDYTKFTYEFPMKEPNDISVHTKYENLRQKEYLAVNGNYLQRHISYLYYGIKSYAYNHLPKSLWNFMKRIICND